MHIDDEPDIREVVRLSLGLDPELSVRSCASGEEALEAIREWRPDLVLLDDVMPRMNGPATLAKLRMNRDTAAIPVVFITGSGQTRKSGYFKALGAAGVLAKPFDADALMAAVRKHLRPKPTAIEAMKKQFLQQAEGYSSELVGCAKALATGANHADVLVHLRQIANRLFDSEGVFAYRLIGADAIALDAAVTEERSETEIQTAIQALVKRISSALDSSADSRSDLVTPTMISN